jgi:hypothetical protein
MRNEHAKVYALTENDSVPQLQPDPVVQPPEQAQVSNSGSLTAAIVRTLRAGSLGIDTDSASPAGAAEQPSHAEKLLPDLRNT